MTPPDDTPPKWLEHSNPTCSDGPGAANALYSLKAEPHSGREPFFLVSDAQDRSWKNHPFSSKLDDLLKAGMEQYEDMEWWMSWRKQLAEALGLVEPSKNRTGVCPSAAIDVAVAAELRKQADELDRVLACEQREGLREAAERLRARATELDQP